MNFPAIALNVPPQPPMTINIAAPSQNGVKVGVAHPCNAPCCATEALFFERVNSAALQNVNKLLREWLPHGQWISGLYERREFRVHYDPSQPDWPFFWHDLERFRQGFDVTSLYGHLQGHPYAIACRELATKLKISPTGRAQCAFKPGWRPIPVCPPIHSFLPPPSALAIFGSAQTGHFPYHNLDGTFRGEVRHFTLASGEYVRLARTLWENEVTGGRFWFWLGFPGAQPWYDQDLMLQNPQSHAFILPDEQQVERMKAALTAAICAESLIPTTCPTGFGAGSDVDWSALPTPRAIFLAEPAIEGLEAALAAGKAASKAGLLEFRVATPAGGELGAEFAASAKASPLTVGQEDLILLPLDELASLAKLRYGIGVTPSSLPVPSIKTFTAAEMPGLQFQEKEYVLEPILCRKGLAMVCGPRGVGKSYLAEALAYAIATGREAFGRWRAPTPRRTLYFDGEMPMYLGQERLSAIAAGFGDATPSSNLVFCCADAQDAPLPSLATTEGQDMVRAMIDGFEMLIVDNLATLAPGGCENSTEGWASLQSFLLELRRKGVAVLVVHHSGKNGEQRGASAREDVLDTSISLRRPEGYQPKEGARVEVRLTKARGVTGKDAEPFEIQLVHENGEARWICRREEDERIAKIRPYLAQGKSLRAIGQETGIPKSTVDRLVKQIRDEA